MQVSASSTLGGAAPPPFAVDPDAAGQQDTQEQDSAAGNGNGNGSSSLKELLPDSALSPNIALQLTQSAIQGVKQAANAVQTAGQQAASEAGRVIGQKAEGIKNALGTAWEATTDWSSAGGQAARASIATGIGNTIQGLGTLIGPSAEDMQAAGMTAAITGDTTSLQLMQAAERTRQAAVEGIAQNVKQSWNDAKARNGTVGASAMVLTTLGTEIIGQKGTGILTHVAVDAAEGAAKVAVKDAVKVAGETKAAAQGGMATAAEDIRFSQNTVSYGKQSVLTYDELVQSMKTNGWQGDPVDVVKMPDGNLTSIDNTRIAAAREAGINVQANIRDFNSPLTPEEVTRFTRNGQVPSTWGEAITLRINGQSGSFGLNNPYGSNSLPKITGKP